VAEIGDAGGVGREVGECVLAVPGEAAGGRRQEAGEQAEQGGFAGAVGAAHEECAAGGEGEGEVAEDQPLGSDRREGVRPKQVLPHDRGLLSASG
jgi:hypothetical protein